MLHILTTDKGHVLLFSGTACLFVVLSLGLAIRVAKQKIRLLVNVRIFLLICVLVVLPIGHQLVEHQETEHDGIPGAYYDAD